MPQSRRPQSARYSEPLASTDVLALVAGMVAAAITGVLAIRFLLRYLQGHNTDIFVVYRIGFAAVVAVLLLMR